MDPFSHPSTASPRRAFGLAEILLLVTILLIGLVNLVYPFSGDQALFTIGARAISHGAVLYRDFWDLKQPGIYGFYLIAGSIFGFTEIGIHAFELIYFTIFAAVLSVSLKQYYFQRSTAILAVLLTVGVYFVICGSWDLTQAEGLVLFPLFCCLWFACHPRFNPRLLPIRFFLFGLATGFVVLFKLLLVVLPIFFITLAITTDVLKRRQSFGAILYRTVLPAMLGGAIVLLPVIGYFAAEHQLGLLYKTFVQYPPRIVSQGHMNSVRILLRGVKWFLYGTCSLLPFMVIGVISRVRRGIDLFTVGLITWIILGTILILVQRMWWEYHFLLLLVPIGLLAAAGFESLLDPVEGLWMKLASSRRVVAVIAILILSIPYALRWSLKVKNEFKAGLPDSSQQQIEFRERVSPAYTLAVQEVHDYGITMPIPGGIYVMGDPLIYFLAGQSQAVPLNGWSPEWFLPEQWDELAGQLTAKKPAYIFIANDDRIMASERGNTFISLIDPQYAPFRPSGEGVWYTRR